jgi:hypothetical protein
MYMRSSWMSGPEPLQGLTAMTHLALSKCYVVPAAGLTGLANLRDLRHLSLSQVTVPGSGELRWVCMVHGTSGLSQSVDVQHICWLQTE